MNTPHASEDEGWFETRIRKLVI